MKLPTRVLPVAVVGALLLTACADAPTSASRMLPPSATTAAYSPEHTVRESLYDMSDVRFIFACTADGEELPIDEGEPVRLHGSVYEKYTERRDPNDGVRVTIQSMPVGLGGIGEESSEAFRVKLQGHETYTQTFAGSTGAWRHNLKLTGLSTGRTFWLVFSGNYRLSAQGEPVIERYATTVSCKPPHGS